MGILWLLKDRLQWPLLLSDACGIELAIIHNFTWHYFFTWRERIAEHHISDYLKRLFRYNLITASIDFPVNLSLLYIFTHFVGIHYVPAKFMALACGFVLKYIANEKIIFRHRKHHDDDASKETLDAPEQPQN